MIIPKTVSDRPNQPAKLTSEPDELHESLIDEVLGEVDDSQRHHEGGQQPHQRQLLLTGEGRRAAVRPGGGRGGGGGRGAGAAGQRLGRGVAQQKHVPARGGRTGLVLGCVDVVSMICAMHAHCIY